MRPTTWGFLAGPAALSGLGLGVFVLVPLLSAWLGLAADGTAAVVLHHASGIGMWLALAWLAARCCDVMLGRLALTPANGMPANGMPANGMPGNGMPANGMPANGASRNGAAYPQLLTDLLRAALFAGAGVAILLLVFNQPATGLITVSSVMIAVIGFALRNVISDLFSGIALGVEHPYRIGDWIETVQGSAGKVTEITWRTTRMIDRNGFSIIIPNGLISGQRLINYSGGERDYRVAVRVPLDGAVPADRAKRILLSGALDAGRHLPGLAPDVVISEYRDGGVSYLVRFRVPDLGQEAGYRDIVYTKVLHALHCAGLPMLRAGPEETLSTPWRSPLPLQSSLPSPTEALLDRVDLFRAFDAAERAELAGKLRNRVVEANEVVVRQGDPGDFLYVIAEGILDVEVARDGALAKRDQLAPGEVFGEMSLLTGQPRAATVTAALRSVIHEIHREDLDPILKRRPAVAEGLAAVMAERQTRNARDAETEPVAPAVRDDFLARLRLLFRL